MHACDRNSMRNACVCADTCELDWLDTEPAPARTNRRAPKAVIFYWLAIPWPYRNLMSVLLQNLFVRARLLCQQAPFNNNGMWVRRSGSNDSTRHNRTKYAHFILETVRRMLWLRCSRPCPRTRPSTNVENPQVAGNPCFDLYVAGVV